MKAVNTITFAAETRGGPAVPSGSGSTTASILLVPDARGQAYVFAKTALEEAGFAWRVTGSVRGYAANLVTSQSPAPGQRGSVYEALTGRPTRSYLQIFRPGDGKNLSPEPGPLISQARPRNATC